MVATGRPLAVILDGLCRLVDTLCDKSLASILLIDPNGRCLSAVQGPAFQKRSWLRWMASRSVLVWVRAERPPTAKSKSSSLTSRQIRSGPIIANWLWQTDCDPGGPHRSCLQTAAYWESSESTGANLAAQLRSITTPLNR
jgi:hypothetical protein